MPLRHQPPSLRKASMVAIAQNFDLICYAAASPGKMAELLNTEEYLNVESPFLELPGHLAEELSDVVKSVSYLRRHHLHALLTPAILKWTSHGVGDLLVALNMLPRRCQNLQRLDIPYLRHINPNVLISLAPSFTSLISLNLRMTLTVDQMLAKIGDQCVHLLELNLSSTAITDRGVAMLCLASDGSAQCQKLCRLSVSDTWVTSAGATVALLALPMLRDFDFERMFEVMRLLDGWCERRVGERVMAALGFSSSRRPLAPRSALRLATVTSSGEAGGEEGPAATVRLCPEATSLTLHATPLSSEALYPLMVLRHLTSLSLATCPGDADAMDFARGVLPLLTALGTQLNSLILSKFSSVDVGAIGKACPHLVNFALSEVTEFELMQQRTSEEYFQELQALEIWADPDLIIPANVLQQLLLFSKKMKNLLFKGVGMLTDEMLREIWKVNPMRNLSHLTLDHCHSITSATFHCILDSDNELTVLRIWSCFRITKEAKNYISQRIIDENMDIYFEWFAFDE